jgi:transcriptional regulator with XRE-family HTH domain
LRKARTAAGVSTDEAGRLLAMERTRIANIESAIRGISPDRVAALLDAYFGEETPYTRALISMAGVRERCWWDAYRDSLPLGLLDIAETEWDARRILTIQSVHVPGLLQTDEYARAVFSAGLPAMSRLQVETRVQHRMERARVIEGPQARPYVGYVHEVALRMRFGGTATMRAQLESLIAASERSNISLRAIPIDAGSFPGAGHALLYCEGPVPDLDTVQLDTAHGPEFLHSPPELEKYRAHLAWMDKHCLSEDNTRDLLRTLTRDL